MASPSHELRDMSADRPDPEVTEKAKRRRYSASYKLGIVQAADACSKPGEIGALLRREGLYSSLLSKWRQQRDASALAGLSKKRGRKHRPKSAEARRVAELERENARLKHQLYKAETMYRVLESEGELRERRRQRRHPNYTKPELLATGPNEVWSWDISKLKGPVKWTYYYLHLILDVFSRYIVGWMLADSVERQGVERDRLTLHSDRGSSMTSKPVALLLADLGMTRSLNRPYTSNDNPFSEAQFKTLKYPRA